MATHEEQLFWREQLPSFYRQANAPKITKGLQAISYNDYAPIPRSSSYPSPLITLPVELLYKIFAFACLEFYGGQRSTYVECVRAKYPTKLVQICRYWRVIALSDSTLWTSIIVTKPNLGVLQRVRLWLARTGTTCPLSLRLGTPLRNDMEDVMKLFLNHIHRWRKVYFVFSPPSMNALQLLAQLPVGSAPQLESIAMESTQPDLFAKTIHQAWTSLTATPSLQMVSIRNEYIPPVPWHQLTYLSLESKDAQTILDTLPHCSSLKVLDISYAFQKGLLQCSSSVILPSLQSLRLHSGMSTGPFLDCLTAPALLNLSISQKEWIGHESHPTSLHNFLARSSCSLKSLTFSDAGLSEAEFVQYIQSPMLSTVTTVVLFGVLSDVVIEALTVRKPRSSTDPPPLFPVVRQLKLSRCKTSKDGMLEAMLLSRLQAGILKRFELLFTGNSIPSDVVSDMNNRFNADVAIYGDW